MKYNLLLLFSFIVLSTSCQITKEDPNVKVINSEELKTLLKDDSIQFIDVRTVEENSENHIKGSINIVYDKNFEQKISQLDKEKPVVVYCRSGRRSAASAKIMANKGFSEVYDLKGGILKWIEEGNMVE